MIKIQDQMCYALPEDGYNELVQAADALNVLCDLLFEARRSQWAMPPDHLGSLLSYAAVGLRNCVREVDSLYEASRN